MYEDAGRSLKDTARIVSTAGFIGSISLAFIIAISGSTVDIAVVKGAAIILALLVGGLGCFAAWFIGLLLHALGEIVDRLTSIDERMATMPRERRMQSYASMRTGTATTSAQDEIIVDTSFVCVCGARNRAGARYCVSCDREFQPTSPNLGKVPTGGWKCSCGRGNASYVTTCSCGKNKREVVKQ